MIGYFFYKLLVSPYGVVGNGYGFAMSRGRQMRCIVISHINRLQSVYTGDYFCPLICIENIQTVIEETSFQRFIYTKAVLEKFVLTTAYSSFIR